MKNILSGLLMSTLCLLWHNSYAADFEASIDFSHGIELSLPVSGVVNRVSVSAGQYVAKGDKMISLDNRPFKSAKSYAQSRVMFHQARLTESQRDLQHQQELFDRTVLSTVELENAELRAKRDGALLEGAKALLARADYEFSYSQLMAPFDALIIAVHVNDGQAINNAIQSKTLLSLVRKGHFVASFYVQEDMLEKLTIELPVTVTIKNSQYPAKISEIFYSPVASNPAAAAKGERRYKVNAGFAANNGSIAAGQSASVLIE